mgnify:CR=1 FL=1
MGDEFVRTPIFDDPFVVVVDATHPLASQKNIHMEDLAEKTLVRIVGAVLFMGLGAHRSGMHPARFPSLSSGQFSHSRDSTILW